MSETLQLLTFGEPRPARVADLEAELSALWRSAAEGPEGSQAVIRACALNLLVYVESEEEGREVSNVVSQVTLQNPCRAIVMITEPTSPRTALTAWISAHCHLPVAGEKQVCSEEISVAASGEAVADLPSVVVPLTVSGLPVYLWWRAGRFQPVSHFNQILRISDHIFVDSARFPDPPADLSSFAARVEKSSGDIAFSDLNWTRLTPWRQLVAQCFDSAELRPCLEQLAEVRVEYEQGRDGDAGGLGRALLMTGWLASRLGWQPRGQSVSSANGTRLLIFKSGAVLVRKNAVPVEVAGSCPGGLVSLTLKTEGSPAVRFALVSQPECNGVLARTELAGRPPIEHTVRLETAGEVELLNEELKFASRDRVYEQALNMVARMTSA
jgi:glucose-6-phosphate dehydrogenase assembly protein OpcA